MARYLIDTDGMVDVSRRNTSGSYRIRNRFAKNAVPGANDPGLLSKGFGVERVQDWIGHANIQSTMEYAKVTNARRDDMAQELKETWR